jgi:NAD(P)-dependent dehydrogenase (short-subunit alcohol dehydrogenase family)
MFASTHSQIPQTAAPSVSPSRVSLYSTRGGTSGCTVRMTIPSRSSSRSVFVSILKAPLEDFTRALAREIGKRGVTVNTVAPGPIDTSFYHGQESPQAVAYATAASVAGRLGAIDDIVPIIEFLASARSQWVTAQTLFINGGYLAR